VRKATQSVSRYLASLSTFEQSVFGTESSEVNHMSLVAWCGVKEIVIRNQPLYNTCVEKCDKTTIIGLSSFAMIKAGAVPVINRCAYIGGALQLSSLCSRWKPQEKKLFTPDTHRAAYRE